jgi:hypothetical protein
MAVVIERVHNGYKLGTSGGMLLGSYTRNQFELSDSQFLDKETVDKTSHLLVLHLCFPLALHPHLVNPWPPQTETLLTALRKDILEVLSTVSLSKN